jgi:Protein of unknown function (DUF1579).
MSLTRELVLVASVALLGAPTASAQMPEPPKPGPEHAILAKDAGTWDAVIEMGGAGGAPAMSSKGVEVGTVGCGGLCLVVEFNAELMPGMPFSGRGLTIYDAKKKKYVGSWSDSMSGTLQISESTYDPAAKAVTGWMEGTDPASGTIVKTKAVTAYPDDDHRVMTMFVNGPDGKEMQTMKISYTRRK